MFVGNYVYVYMELRVLNCESTYHIYMNLLKFYLRILLLLYNWFICVVVVGSFG
jgi:hypothetical protein